MIRDIFPFLEARDVAATVDFYCTRLGFERVNSAEEEANGVFAVRSATVHLAFVQARPDRDSRALGTGVRFYLGLDDVDAHYARARASGAEILEALVDKPYRMREYTMRDPNGYLLTFGQQLGAQ